MNKIFTFLAAIIVATSVFAQSPEKLSYQAVLRNASRQLVVSQRVGMQISILQGSVDGAAVYIETQIDTTSVSGMVTIEIGTGVTSDDFSAINWSNGPYFVKTETDPNGGTDYTMTGVSQLMSVPYAFHAKSAVAVTGEKPELFGKCLIFQVLPMTQAVYGLLTAILLMMGAGLLGGGGADMSNPMLGTSAIGIGLVVGLTGISAANQGMVASASISATARNPEVAARGIIYTVMPETIAIFGLLVGILLMTGLGLL